MIYDGSKNQKSVINISNLAALDIAFLGPKLILAEYSVGVFLSAAIGLVTLKRSHSAWQMLWEDTSYHWRSTICPLLLYAVASVRRGSAHAEVANELAHRDQSFRRYRLNSLLLLVPLAVPVLAIRQERQKAIDRGSSMD